ncbi:NAD(P)-binding protein [Gymnopus androsaceus JB14]|uniref:NAD(P)-binding protein n=1 Tax=Gymnopus androsaceus JB14 TaxID=1447944 RepID=A0A6A4IHC7_9AGAR|nr:NAD(P)-binding protein [Gymnopus androsaceus JB14]
MPVPELGRSDSTFELKEIELPELKEDQVLLQTIFFSNDPAQRGWIQKDQDADRLYIPPVRPGDLMLAGALCKVLKSTSASVKEGALVQAYVGWTEQAVLDAKAVTSLPDLPGLSPSVFLGALGGPGLTAFFGLKEICKLEEGQEIIVSGAAGATGNVVVQLAKHVFKASKVIAIAGSDDKCEWLKKIGADVALNYKSPSFSADLAQAAKPSYVDCYFDNVGGSILNACLSLIKKHGRVAACGAIAAYNDRSQTVLDNWVEVIMNRITVQGFVVIDYYSRRAEAIDVLSTAVKEGKLSVSGGETIVRCTEFEKVPEVWMRLFSGQNTGKLVTQIADL